MLCQHFEAVSLVQGHAIGVRDAACPFFLEHSSASGVGDIHIRKRHTQQCAQLREQLLGHI